MKTVIIDNYDSFTFNLYHYVEQLCDNLDVVRNDAFSLEFLDQYDQIILSPGPGIPSHAGQLMQIIHRYKCQKRILGICLGHQALVEAYGGKLKNMPNVLHGQAVETYIDSSKSYIFSTIPDKILTGRYHSFVADNQSLSKDFEIIATDIHGDVQGIQHKEYDIIGLQFHPESIMTDYGFLMIKNWVEKGNSAEIL